MRCEKCGSNNVTLQVVNEQQLKNKHHGAFWWIFIGWWWVPIKWTCFTVPAILAKIFGSKKQKIKNIQKKVLVCQDCGHTAKAD